MAYTKQTWADLPSKTTPINASRLGHIEQGIFDAAQTADNAASAAGSLATRVGQAETAITTLNSNKAAKTDIAKVEDDSTASTEILEGEQFYHNSVLYEATSDISVGDSFIVSPTTDYNCKLSDSVTEQIKAVKDGLGTASTKNSTSVVTDSTDLVESGAVFDAVQGQTQLIEDTAGWLGGNKCVNNAVSKTENGVTWTVNADKSISAYGQPTEGDAYIDVNAGVNVSANGVALICNGCPSGGANDKYYSQIRLSNPNGSWYGARTDTGNGYQLTQTEVTANVKIQYRCVIPSGAPAIPQSSPIVFIPMIISPNEYAISPSYRPNHKSVEESLEQKCDNSVIAPTENGTTASQAYAVGSHAIRNDAFITWKNAKTQGETINDASDYTSGDISALNSAIDFSGDCNNLADGYVYYTSGGSHAPSNYCIIQTISNFGNTVKTQKAVHVAGGDNIVYIRSYVSGSGWSSWYKFEGTIVS